MIFAKGKTVYCDGKPQDIAMEIASILYLIQSSAVGEVPVNEGDSFSALMLVKLVADYLMKKNPIYKMNKESMEELEAELAPKIPDALGDNIKFDIDSLCKLLNIKLACAGKDVAMNCDKPAEAAASVNAVLREIESKFTGENLVEALDRITHHAEGMLRVALSDYEYNTGIQLAERPPYRENVWDKRDLECGR